MPPRTDSRSNRRQPRRPRCFRAAIEVLDPRRLMAGGLADTVFPVTGNAGSPIVTRDNPLVGIPEVESADGYSGTINWGDGTATDAATIVEYLVPSPSYFPSNSLAVSGPDHTYASPGTYTITISVTAPGATTPTILTDTATISATLVLTGGLDPATASRSFGTNEVITTDLPTFTGTTAPGSTVEVFATNITTGQGTFVGSGIADDAGNWSVTPYFPLADGIYSISALAVSPVGGSTTTVLIGNPGVYPTSLDIDATGPKVTGFQVTNLKTGTFQVDYSDPSGIEIGPTVDLPSISVSRTVPGSKRAQALRVTKLTDQGRPLAYAATPATDFIPVVGKFAVGKSLPRNATYVFTIHSAAIIGLSGANLDGEFAGRFPSGDGVAGGDFQVKFTVRNGKVSGPLPITSTAVATRSVHAKAVARHHA